MILTFKWFVYDIVLVKLDSDPCIGHAALPRRVPGVRAASAPGAARGPGQAYEYNANDHYNNHTLYN